MIANPNHFLPISSQTKQMCIMTLDLDFITDNLYLNCMTAILLFVSHISNRTDIIFTLYLMCFVIISMNEYGWMDYQSISDSDSDRPVHVCAYQQQKCHHAELNPQRCIQPYHALMPSLCTCDIQQYF